MIAQIERLSVQSVMAYLEEILTDNGFVVQGSLSPSSPTATIMLSFPMSDDQKTIIKPLIIVSYVGGNNVPLQIGTDDVSRVQFIIDLYAKDDGQRDDVGYIIRKNFVNRRLPVYDFNTGFPSVVGDYSGISTKGKMIILSTSFFNPEPDIHEVANLSHHQEIRLDILLPLDV